jgi:hypothetical protein
MDWNMAKEIGEGVAVASFVGFGVFHRLRQSRIERKYNLGPNPTRCADHEDRLRSIEKSVVSIDKGVAIIETRAGIIEKRLDNIGSVFNMSGGDRI